MSLPKQLIESFETIKGSRVIGGDFSRDALREFVETLNNAIPSPYNSNAYTIYRFNRFKYLSNKERFILDIKDFKPYDALILWTDYMHILTYFNLVGKIFLGWDKAKNRYRACPLSNNTQQKQTTQLDVQKNNTDDLQLGIESVVDETVVPSVNVTQPDTTTTNDMSKLETMIDSINNDQDIIFSRMNEAFKRLNNLTVD